MVQVGEIYINPESGEREVKITLTALEVELVHETIHSFLHSGKGDKDDESIEMIKNLKDVFLKTRNDMWPST